MFGHPEGMRNIFDPCVFTEFGEKLSLAVGVGAKSAFDWQIPIQDRHQFPDRTSIIRLFQKYFFKLYYVLIVPHAFPKLDADRVNLLKSNDILFKI